MSDTSDASTQMAPAIKDFFTKALPSGKGGHVLVLGEGHTKYDHIKYLNQHLSKLIKDNQLGTLGLECPAFINVFFWAYQDGTLTKMLGSKEDAKRYLIDINVSMGDYLIEDNRIHHANLALNALDEGCEVVAYDSRDTLEDAKNDYASSILRYHDQLSNAQSKKSCTAEEASAIFRQPIKGKVSNKDMCFVLHEVDALLAANPDYKTRLDKIEKLITVGRKIEIGSDALSATILSAAAKPCYNILSIGGVDHINTKGVNDDGEHERIHGTFPEHLERSHALGVRPLHVTSAVLAGVGWADKVHEREATPSPFASANLDILTKDYLRKARINRVKENDLTYLPLRRENPTKLVNIDTAVITDLPQPSEEDSVPIEARFYDPSASGPENHTIIAIIAQRMNPLLVPAIKKAYDAVRADWNPELAQDQAKHEGGRG